MFAIVIIALATVIIVFAIVTMDALVIALIVPATVIIAPVLVHMIAFAIVIIKKSYFK